MTKQFMLSLVFVLALGIGLGGAFSGGVAFGKSQGEEAALTQQPPLLQQQSESEFGHGGLTGVIEKVEGNIVTVNTSQGPLIATLVADTTIGRFTEGTSADLQTGMQVTIVGQIGADNGVKAMCHVNRGEFLGWKYAAVAQGPIGAGPGGVGDGDIGAGE